MQEKKFKHKKIEKCKLCDKEIDANKDEWAVIIDYTGKKQIAIGFYHRKCFQDLITGKVDAIKQKFEDRLGVFVKKMFGNMDLKATDFGMRLKELTA